MSETDQMNEMKRLAKNERNRLYYERNKNRLKQKREKVRRTTTVPTRYESDGEDDGYESQSQYGYEAPVQQQAPSDDTRIRLICQQEIMKYGMTPQNQASQSGILPLLVALGGCAYLMRSPSTREYVMGMVGSMIQTTKNGLAPPQCQVRVQNETEEGVNESGSQPESDSSQPSTG